MTVKHIETVYDSYAWIYDLLFGKVFQSGRERAPVLLKLFPGAKLLEVGVGTGLSLPQCARNVQFTGVDLSQKMLQRARKRVQALGLRRIELLKMDATTLEFPDNSFDRVLAAYFISTVPDPVRVIQEMRRVCRPGGYLVFLNHFHSENPVVRVFEKMLSPLFYRIGFKTDLDLWELMDASGLELDRVENIDFLGHWKAVRCCNRKESSRTPGTDAPLSA
jgi:phosphatidylethanolamine/phosphatidyl-N-methylethanolamine N-methyltransferase